MADDVADDDAGGAVVEGQDVVPVTTHRGAVGGGHVADGQLQAGHGRHGGRQQRPLEALGDLVLLLVGPGVADGQCGPVGDLDGQVEVVVVQVPIALGSEDEHAEHLPP